MKLVTQYVEGKNVASIYREQDYFTLWFGTTEDGVLTHSLRDFFTSPGAAFLSAQTHLLAAEEDMREEVTNVEKVAA